MDANGGNETSNESDEHFREVIDKLRDRLPSLLPKAYSALIELGFEIIEKGRRIIGPRRKRVFCFGPYPEGGRGRINHIAQKVSKLGYTALTGFGFYRANDSDTLHPLTEMMPPIVMKLKESIPGHIFFHELPRLASKATVDMTIERGQNDELRGCYDHKIPCLGYVIRETIWKRNHCMFLTKLDGYVECKSFDKSLCMHNNGKRCFCPFTEPTSISWFSLQLFLTRDNTLVAAKELGDLDPALERFLKFGAEKPYPK
jgi:hypothetical protein